MISIGRAWRCCAGAVAIALVLGTLAQAYQAVAQSTGAVYDVGSRKAEQSTGHWPNWSLVTDVDIGSANWTAVNVVNTSCFIGPDDPRAGTANAGAIAWTAALYPAPGPSGLLVLGGTLNPIEGSSATGTVTVVPAHGSENFTRIDVHVDNMEEFAEDNTFSVCIGGS